VQPGMSDVAGQLFDSGDETLPDGTRVAVHQGPGEKGGAGVVMWTVDTLRTDGRRVMISAFNSGTQNDAATRDTPALTIAQMREMALSPQWFSAR
jgi:NAD(P)H-hydrate repair Nnr-like enzyme with NAD(P)H-hydrate epimerase domain